MAVRKATTIIPHRRLQFRRDEKSVQTILEEGLDSVYHLLLEIKKSTDTTENSPLYSYHHHMNATRSLSIHGALMHPATTDFAPAPTSGVEDTFSVQKNEVKLSGMDRRKLFQQGT